MSELNSDGFREMDELEPAMEGSGVPDREGGR